jgi:hypothetical protein
MRAGALRAQIRVAGEGLFGWMVPGVFIRVEPVALGGGAQDSSALPHDFLIAEVYKEKRQRKFVYCFLLSHVPVVLPDVASWRLVKSIDTTRVSITDEQSKRGITLKGRTQ